MIQLSLWKICEKSVSCTRLRILLNTICRKPGFNSLRTPLNHGAEKRAMKLWNKHNSVTDQMLPRAGKLYWKNTWQYCIPRPQAQRNSRGANTGAQLRIARLQAPLRGKDKAIKSYIHHDHIRGGSKGVIGAIAPRKTYERNFIHHDFVQIEKLHSRYKAILPSIVLSQQYCEVYFISLTVVNAYCDLTTKCCWNRSPSSLTGWIRPCITCADSGASVVVKLILFRKHFVT